MAVTSQHDEYDDKHDAWDRMRDFIEGASAVKEVGETYLPKLDRQSKSDYVDYLNRALFYRATGRTHQALLGSVFRKDPMIELPEDMSGEMVDVSMMDLSMIDFSRKVVDEVLATGRYGVLVEFSDDENRPYFVGYKAERIRNWREERIDGKTVLTMVVLEEVDNVEGDTEFDTVEKTRYRALKLIDGIYTVEVFESEIDGEEEGTGDPVLIETITPLRNGEPLEEIPFYFFSPDNLQSEISKPPLLDLVEVNKSHYQTSADLENGRHLIGLPTPIFIGFDAQDKEIVLGAKNALSTENLNARAFFLEFAGAGLGNLERALAQKEQLMASMGARLLEAPRSGVETAETARIRQAGESSLLGMVTRVCSEGLSSCLKKYAWWNGLDNVEKVTVELNTDFVDWGLTGADVAGYVQSYLAGGMSFDTLFYTLEKGEVYKPGTTMEEEQARLDAQGPTGLTATGET